MSDWYMFACPKCHSVVGGWNMDKAPLRCPVCGGINFEDGISEWGEKRP